MVAVVVVVLTGTFARVAVIADPLEAEEGADKVGGGRLTSQVSC